MIDKIKIDNTISIASLPLSQYSLEDLRGIDFETVEKLAGVEVLGSWKNLIMNTWKEQYNTDLWDRATRLLITNQYGAPTGEESLPTSGIIYEVGQEWETRRKAGNPYRIAYGLTAQEADGQWGSLIWATEQDEMINRVRVSTRKDPGKIIFLEIKASMS
jgi:hypothetical protein